MEHKTLKTIIIAGSVAATAAGFSHFLNNSKTVFDGKINNTHVKYEEGRRKNQMSMKIGENKYANFVDYKNKTSVYSKDRDDIFNDELEEVAITENDRVMSRYIRDSKGIVHTPLGVFPINHFFKKADLTYNMARTAARFAEIGDCDNIYINTYRNTFLPNPPKDAREVDVFIIPEDLPSYFPESKFPGKPVKTLESKIEIKVEDSELK
jgi:hypothetical protein